VGGAPLSKSLVSKIYGQKSCVYETFGMTETLTHIAVKNISSGDSSFSILPNVSISQDSRGCLIVSAPNLSVHNLHTNDIVNKISDYKFLWLGRYDNVINSGGIKIQPEILEKHIEGQIKNRFFITSIPDNKINEKVILIVEGKTQKFDLKWNPINPLMRPKEIYFTKKFFENKSGKIQRKKTLYSLNLYNP
jgi:O-succinylbenzoic acid--CoA ligase